jgi:hypothetical protein
MTRLEQLDKGLRDAEEKARRYAATMRVFRLLYEEAAEKYKQEIAGLTEKTAAEQVRDSAKE